MHIHGAILNVQGANFASISSGERSAAAQRAAEVRKKLLSNAPAGAEDTAPDASLLAGQWLDSRHCQVLSGDEYRGAASGKDPDFG